MFCHITIKKSWYTNQRVTRYDLLCLWVVFIVHELRISVICTSYKLPIAYKLRVFVYCISYELSFALELRVTVYCASYVLDTSYKLLFIAWVMSYFLNTNYELLIIAWVTSFIFHTSYELVLIHELRVNVYCTDYFLKGFFVTLILTFLEHEKIRRSGVERRIPKWRKFVMAYFRPNIYLRPKIARTELFFFFETRNHGGFNRQFK